MANIFVGFHDRKNCSRILKPPGGGTSDIFNTSVTEKQIETNEIIPTETPETTPTSSPTKELPCPLNGIDIKSAADKIETSDNQQNGETVPVQNETLNIENLSMTNEKPVEETQEKTNELNKDINESKNQKSESVSSVVHENQHKEKVTTTPEKKIGQRVPPGGYSSGLW